MPVPTVVCGIEPTCYPQVHVRRRCQDPIQYPSLRSLLLLVWAVHRTLFLLYGVHYVVVSGEESQVHSPKTDHRPWTREQQKVWLMLRPEGEGRHLNQSLAYKLHSLEPVISLHARKRTPHPSCAGKGMSARMSNPIPARMSNPIPARVSHPIPARLSS